ncbi:MAG: hypothetical protein IPF98_13770 [Gemmatimonadetes bacterium]|nr:hypothetical protein [Gemmatimonadota bacterium]MCC6774399.1 hypothetical protein [Gemmatimonadaceae bacterium]
MRARLVQVVLLAVGCVGFAAPVRGQGTLSTQGFGYPLGGLSTRAAATGGALSEFDHLSSRNPAALTLWGRTGLYVQYDPEFRSVESGAATDRTTTSRFGAIAAGFTVGERWSIGVSSHAFLDRSWATNFRSGQRLGDDSVSYAERFSSKGGINDNRVAVAYRLHPKVVLGAGLHLLSGENRLNLVREFDDSVRYGTLTRDISLTYSGTAASAGIVVSPFRRLALAGSYRQGGSMKLRVVDTLRTEANVPSRYGVAVRLEPLSGVSLLVGADRTEWSRMNGLGSASAAAQDTWEYSAGAQFAGQRLRNTPWTYSVGYRQRDLPFAAAGVPVTEKLFAGGLGIPIAGPRGMLELALQRAVREAATATSERAWLLSVGFIVRP